MGSKNPAFLFYVNDYYEGTRMLLPEERSCYVDLLVKQHQEGHVPDDIRRLAMYCNVSPEVVENVLSQKFVRENKHWVNLKLKRVQQERSEYQSRQRQNGIIGNFWKGCKKHFSTKQYKDIKKHFEGIKSEELIEILTNTFGKIPDKQEDFVAVGDAVRNAMRTHSENENENIKSSSSDILSDSEFIKILKSEYPTKDVDSELQRMKNWLRINKKTKSDYPRFARNWLNGTRDSKRAAKASDLAAQEAKMIERGFQKDENGTWVRKRG